MFESFRGRHYAGCENRLKAAAKSKTGSSQVHSNKCAFPGRCEIYNEGFRILNLRIS